MKITLAFVIGLLTIGVANAAPSEQSAIRPFLLDCARCSEVRIRETGNTADGNPIISERVRCRGCTVEFREDLECLPPVFPQPQP